MSEYRLPVLPNLDQLKHQAKDLLRAIKRGDPEAVEQLRTRHPSPPDPAQAKLRDAQLVLARLYEAPNWLRIVHACQIANAIWADDRDTVFNLVRKYPALLHEDVHIRKGSNWGPPMSYAANVGRDEIIEGLHQMGATDLEKALGRATLQGKIRTAEMIHAKLGHPVPGDGSLGDPAYTLSASGTELMLRLGARVKDEEGRRIAPVDVVLETDSRKPEQKHRILEMYVEYGLELPDTPPMALHRGRIDLLEKHLERDPGLLSRTFTHEEIYPPEMGCHDEVLATHGTPLAGTTLLHMCVDYDEMEIALWLFSKGMEVDAPAAIDADGFGGHTALFSTVVSQPNFWMNLKHQEQVAPFTELFLAKGANPRARASLRKQLHPGYGPPPDAMHEFRDVTPVEWGERFQNQTFVSQPALSLIREAS